MTGNCKGQCLQTGIKNPLRVYALKLDWGNGYNYRFTENHWTVYLEGINYIKTNKQTKNISSGEELKKESIIKAGTSHL